MHRDPDLHFLAQRAAYQRMVDRAWDWEERLDEMRDRVTADLRNAVLTGETITVARDVNFIGLSAGAVMANVINSEVGEIADPLYQRLVAYASTYRMQIAGAPELIDALEVFRQRHMPDSTGSHADLAEVIWYGTNREGNAFLDRLLRVLWLGADTEKALRFFGKGPGMVLRETLVTMWRAFHAERAAENEKAALIEASAEYDA